MESAFLVAFGASLLLAGGLYLIGFTRPGLELSLIHASRRGATVSPGAKANPHLVPREARGEYEQRVHGGKLYILQGKVTNTGKNHRGWILVAAALLDNNGKVVAEQAVHAGNVLSIDTVRNIDPDTVFNVLRTGGNERRSLRSGTSIPFMVVFFDPPEKIDSFQVSCFDAD